MKALIKLTITTGDTDIWVNPRYIASMAVGYKCTNVFMANDCNPVFVKESPEEIISLINSINK